MIGQTVLHYRVSAALGAGGMGAVYRATDTRLGREVAIKVLPPDVALDARRLERFRREAQLLATLNHPNIAAIYGLEEADGQPFLALELVEGEDLAERLKRGPLPVDEALEAARQIAEALEEAHERGVVHRDLKPANVKVRPDGKVKVLDFGLAKAYVADPASGPVPELSQSPTLAHTGTQAGVLLGTAAYMAPEQARGKPIDRRADIWAFGVVLFEMLAGRRLFEGETVSDVLASVLKTEPDWTTLPRDVPPEVRELLRRCLVRDPKSRLRDVGDARLVLDEAIGATRGVSSGSLSRPGVPVVVPRPGRERAWMAVAAVSTILAAVLAVMLAVARSSAPPSAPALRATIPLPAGLRLDGMGSPVVALSPDGRALAFVARDASGFPQLWVRRLDETEARLVPGSETAEGPFFSPDGRWVVFAVGVSLLGGVPPELRKYSLDTGLTQTVCGVVDYFGGTWTDDRTILFVGVQPRGLWTVDAGGGAPRPLVERFREGEREAAETVAWPELLPGGRAVLLDDLNAGGSRMIAVDLRSRQVKDLGLKGWGARYLPTGHLAFAGKDGALMAVRFDVRALRVTGTPVAVAPEVAFARNYSPAFAVSRNGTIVRAVGYLQGSRREPMRVVRAARGRPPTVVPVEADLYSRGFAISPDGRSLALNTWHQSIWLVDLARATRAKLPAAGMTDILSLRWTPDGSRLAVASTREGTSGFAVYAMTVGGADRVDTLLPAAPSEFEVAGWSRDGRQLLYVARDPAGGTNLVRRAEGEPPQTFHREPGGLLSARVSPDGRYVAFDSNSSGAFEVYVYPLEGGGGRLTVTSAGGRRPIWSHDGRELLFSRGRQLVSVSVEPAAGGLHLGPERVVVEWDAVNYDVAPDGTLYGLEPVPGAALQASLQVQTGWFAEVERLAGR